MKTPTPNPSFELFEARALARHVLFDLSFPVLGTLLVLALNAWLLHGRVSNTAIAAWLLFAVVSVLARELFLRHMKRRWSHADVSKTTLLGQAILSAPMGAVSGVFAWMYFDAQQAMNLVILSTYMTVIVVGAVVPLSVYLPGFFMLVLPAYVPYLLRLLQSGGTEHLVVAGINVLFLVVVFNYARQANQMLREAVRLRYENQNLIDDLALRKGEAEKALLIKGLFLAGVSHDLKQPIRAIAHYASFLRHHASPGGASDLVLQTADKIESAVSAVHGQISHLLELSQLESGAVPVSLESVELDDLFAHARELLASQAQERGVQLRFALGHRRQAWADRRMLESIVINFISNAIKHAQGSRVYIGTRLRTTYPEGQRLCIEVRDNGRGIAAYQLPLLFDAYRTFDDRVASESHGLGLAISRAQATYLGCDIDVRSEPGRGSTFTLCGIATSVPR